MPGGLDVDQEVVDGRGPAEGGQQVPSVDGVDISRSGAGVWPVPVAGASDRLSPGVGGPGEGEGLIAVPDGGFFQGASVGEVRQVAPCQDCVVVVGFHAKDPGLRVAGGEVGCQQADVSSEDSGVPDRLAQLSWGQMVPEVQELQGCPVAGPGAQPHHVAVQLCHSDRYGGVRGGLVALTQDRFDGH